MLKTQKLKCLFVVMLFLAIFFLPSHTIYASKTVVTGKLPAHKADKFFNEKNTRYNTGSGHGALKDLDLSKTTKTLLWTTERLGASRGSSKFNVAIYNGDGCNDAEYWYTKFSEIDPNNSNS